MDLYLRVSFSGVLSKMARRLSSTGANPDQTEQNSSEDVPGSTKNQTIAFGHNAPDHPEIDDEILEGLDIPPPLSYHSGLEGDLRPNAIFMYNRSIALLTTEQIISHVLQLLGDRVSTFTHLEWVDDFSCVLAFNSNKDAIEALTGLLMKPDEVEGENGLPEAFAYLLSDDSPPDVLVAAYEFISTPRPTKPFSSKLFDENPKNKLHRPTKPEQLVPFARFATKFDVKDSSSRKRSLFYALHGTNAGQDGVLAKRAGSLFPKTPRTLSYPKASSGRWTHVAPLDQTHTLPPRSIRRLPSRATNSDLSISAALDNELDRFMKNSGDINSYEEETASVNGKRGRGKISTTEDEERTRRRKVSSSITTTRVQQPTIELLPDRPGTCGGNLRDELFQSSTLITDFEGNEHKVYPYESPYQTEEPNSNRLDQSEEPYLPEDDEDQGNVNERQSEEHIEDENIESDDRNRSNANRKPTNSKASVPQDKTRWGPLFSRLY